jgi:hypothetical protein
MEDDRQKFVRLANSRVNKAIKAIRIVGNLSNRSNYSYSSADVDRIFRVLSQELRSCRQRFSSEGLAEEGDFKIE